MVYYPLKSDQNGIEISGVPQIVGCSPWLKSDQNGIEIYYMNQINYFCRELKSDQNGIEIRCEIIHLEELLKVKIRPKWD